MSPDVRGMPPADEAALKHPRFAAPQPDLIRFDPLIAVCAFRYALGRMTYMVGHVGGWLISNRERLPESDRALIVREIDDAARRNGLGMECDRVKWMQVRAAMVDKD